MSSKGRDIPQHVRLEPSTENGLGQVSYVKCEQMQTVSKALLRGLVGRITDDDLDRVGAAVRKALGL